MQAATRNDPDVLLQVEDLAKHFPVGGGAFGSHPGVVRALDGVSFSLHQGETLAVVGESGCGKSTLGRCIARLLPLTAGRIVFAGRDITSYSRSQMRPLRRDMMMIFQDPFGSLDPRMRVGTIIAEPLQVHGYGDRRTVEKRVRYLLERVGLSPEHYDRFPHEFSGGQRQRIGIARALAVEPKLIICDEPVSALDVSVQAQILNLLADLQEDFGLTYLFITHNLDVVRHIADRVLVMYLGRVVEEAAGADLFRLPRHPYTASLLSAVPIPEPQLARTRRAIVLEGDVPSPVNPPAACRFHPRCPRAQEICGREDPAPADFGHGHRAWCHFPVQSWPLKSPDEIRSIARAL
jgi:oligopeptide/dipeptide ABC transporter ATP-binding protein